MNRVESYYQKCQHNCFSTDKISKGLWKLKVEKETPIWMLVQQALTEFIKKELKK